MVVYLPSGGWRRSPCFSEKPMGCRSDESTSRQKSFLSSLPSKRNLNLGPTPAITVATQVDVRLRGSADSSFISGSNSFSGGSRL